MPVDLSAPERQHSCPQQVALRARIILLAADGAGVRQSSRQLGVARSTVQGWRWRSGSGSLGERLADAPRPGTPAIFTAKQVCAIVAIARESPLESGRPITHWTQQELADEATSQRSVGRILKKEADLKPPPHAGLVERQAGRAL